MKRDVILYIAMSLDGFIAKDDGNLDFLAKVEMADEDYGYSEIVERVDTVIWGRKTFDKVLTFSEELPYQDKNVFVISKTKKGNHGHVVFRDNVVELINELKSKPGKDIYCDGGGEVVFELLNNRLIDIIVVSVIPHLLGDGVRLFKDDRVEQNIKLKESITFPSGLVQLWYDVE